MTFRLINHSEGISKATLLLAHGAGAPMDHPFMEHIATGLSNAGWTIVRFEFPYMALRRQNGRKRPPDRLNILQDAFKSEVALLDRSVPCVIGGKSMGGRIASLIIDDLARDFDIKACLCLGYPFHPIGRPSKQRTDHLESLHTPTLIVQGERDPMGNFSEVNNYSLSDTVQLSWIKDGDHNFKPRKSSGLTEAENLGSAIKAVDFFLKNSI